MNGDGALDLVVASSLYSANATSALLLNTASVLAQAGADAPAGFSHVIAHQVSLESPEKNGGLDVAGATWESTQAPIANKAPHVFLSGSTQFPGTPTGDPGTDNVGWFVQAAIAADLDAPGSAGFGSTDLVLVEGVRSLSSALGGDPRGCVVIRQADPVTKVLGPTWYLDPTDMGVLPTHAAVADVLSSSRATLGFPAPLGSRDIVVANTGDSSLTLYYQYAPASGTTPPTYTSFHLALDTIVPGLPSGDTAGVAIGDLDGDGSNDLVVVGQLSQTAIIFLYDPSGPDSLGPSTGGLFPFRVGPVIKLPQLLCGRPVVADITNDGKPDLLIPSYITDQLLVFVNDRDDAQGNPTFAEVTFATGFQPNGVAAVDLDGDGRPDVVVANSETSDLYTYFQVTPGTLIEQFVPIPSGDTPLLLACGDVTGDGIPEVIVPVENGNSIYVYGRDPESLLKVIATYDVSSPAAGVSASQPVGVAVGPVFQAGKNDIAIALTSVIDASGIHGGFEVVTGTPLGQGISDYAATSASSLSVAVGDLDGDGIPDVVVCSPADVTATIFYGAGHGAFAPPVTRSGSGYRFVKIVDLDGDGHMDLVVSCNAGFDVYYGAATGGVPATATTIATASVFQPATFEVGDVNSDGLLDLVGAGFGTTIGTGGGICYQTAPRVFAIAPLRVGGEAAGVAIGDLDGDGRNDVAIAWGSDDVVAIYYQDPTRQGQLDSLRPPVLYHTASEPSGCVILDVNGDGKNDVVVAARGANSLNVFLQR